MTMTTEQDLYPTRLEAPRPPLERSHPTVWGDAASGPFTQDELDAHEARGFTVLEDFVTAEEVTRYSDELDRLAADPALATDPRVVRERSTGAVRSIFAVP